MYQFSYFPTFLILAATRPGTIIITKYINFHIFLPRVAGIGGGGGGVCVCVCVGVFVCHTVLWTHQVAV
jgi:hypothetical protein